MLKSAPDWFISLSSFDGHPLQKYDVPMHPILRPHSFTITHGKFNFFNDRQHIDDHALNLANLLIFFIFLCLGLCSCPSIGSKVDNVPLLCCKAEELVAITDGRQKCAQRPDQ
eukprot:6711982-Ditylum_brightwellii.AAC.1